MLQLHPSQMTTYVALKRLLKMRFSDAKEISSKQLENLYFLSSEHSFSRDVVNEILDECELIPDSLDLH